MTTRNGRRRRRHNNDDDDNHRIGQLARTKFHSKFYTNWDALSITRERERVAMRSEHLIDLARIKMFSTQSFGHLVAAWAQYDNCTLQWNGHETIGRTMETQRMQCERW